MFVIYSIWMENIIEKVCLNAFRHDLSENKTAHAYLVVSPDEVFNKMVAYSMAGFLLCNEKTLCGECLACKKTLAGTNPDFHVYPKGKNFLVDDAVSIIEKSIESPMGGSVKVFLVNNIDLSTLQAQNKILKTLEEPSKSNVFILTATNENKILPTVISRTRKEYLLPLEKEQIKNIIENPPALYKEILPSKKNYIGNELNDAISFGEGWIGKTINALESKFFSQQKNLVRKISTSFSSSKDFASVSAEVLKFKDELKNFLVLLKNEHRNLLVHETDQTKCEGQVEIIKEIHNCFQEIERNVNVNLIVDNLLMKILEIKYLYKLN